MTDDIKTAETAEDIVKAATDAAAEASEAMSEAASAATEAAAKGEVPSFEAIMAPQLKALEAVEEAMSKAEAALTEQMAKSKEVAEKAAAEMEKAAADLKTAREIASDAAVAHRVRLVELTGDLISGRADANASILAAGDVKEAMAIEQQYAGKVYAAMTDGMKELYEIRMKAYKDATAPFVAQMQKMVEGMGKLPA